MRVEIVDDGGDGDARGGENVDDGDDDDGDAGRRDDDGARAGARERECDRFGRV